MKHNDNRYKSRKLWAVIIGGLFITVFALLEGWVKIDIPSEAYLGISGLVAAYLTANVVTKKINNHRKKGE